jgi:hypothetical protein
MPILLSQHSPRSSIPLCHSSKPLVIKILITDRLGLREEDLNEEEVFKSSKAQNL